MTTKTYSETAAPTSSPWGKPDDATRLAAGVWSVGTPGHGGIKLSPARNAAVPAAARAKGGWYEEDCAWAVCAIIHPDAFTERQRELARASVGRWQTPAAFEALTGETATAANCDKVAEAEHKAKHKDSLLGMSAWGDWCEAVPDGAVLVFYGRGGRTPQGQYPAETGYCLTTGERYEGRTATRGEYVVDPTVDTMLPGAPEGLHRSKKRAA